MQYKEVSSEIPIEEPERAARVQYLMNRCQGTASFVQDELQEGELDNHLNAYPGLSNLLSVNIDGSELTNEQLQEGLPHSSPASSTPSLCGSQISQNRKTVEQDMDSFDAEYARIIRESEAFSAPFATTSKPDDEDPIDSFIHFVRTLLRSFKDEELKLKVMANISQAVIDAKTKEIKRIQK